MAVLLLTLGTAAWAHDFKAGSLRIDHPYAPPTLAGKDSGAVYFRFIRNTGTWPMNWWPPALLWPSGWNCTRCAWSRV